MKKVDQKTKEKVNIKSDFKQFFIDVAGSSKIKQAQFEQVSDSESSSQSDDDFREQDDQVQQEGIKTFQFWSGIKFPKEAPKVSNQAVQWKVSCPFSFGFNSLGRDNIIYIDGLICKAFGCLLIFNNQIYTKHNKKITTLAFNSEALELLTATQKPSPELFLWKYDSEQKTFQFKRRFVVGSKGQDIYSVSFFQEDYVVCVDLFTLHKSSTLYCFSKDDGTKLASIKVSKFYDLELLSLDSTEKDQENEKTDRLFYSNDEGIGQLVIESSEDDKTNFKTVKTHLSDKICCLMPFYDEKKGLQIVYGDRDGNIHLASSKESLKVHQGWIFELKAHKHQNKQYFIALGAMDLKLSVIETTNKKIKLLKKLQLGGYGRSISIQNDLLLIGKRDGDYQQFSLTQLIEEKNQQKIKSKKTLSLKCFESKDKKREYFFQVNIPLTNNKIPPKLPSDKQLEYPTKRYVYGHSKSKSVSFLTIGNKSIQDIEFYPLRYYAQTLDAHETVIAYIYFVEKEEDGMVNSGELGKTGKTNLSKTLSKTQKKVSKLVLIVEDTSNKSLLAKIAIQTPEYNKYAQLYANVKFSPSGNILAVSDSQGSLWVLARSKKGDFSTQMIKADKKSHKQGIRQITWSKDERYIKTISDRQLYYWQVQGQANTQMRLLSAKSSQITQVQWVSMSKFGWQTKNIWQSTDIVNDIYKFWSQQHTQIQILQTRSSKQIQGRRQTVIGCVRNDGCVRIYNYPGKGSIHKEMRINDGRFEVCGYNESCERFCFFVVIEGMVVLIQLDRQK